MTQPSTRNKIVELYTAGLPGPAIARRLGVLRAEVYRALVSANVPRRAKGRPVAQTATNAPDVLAVAYRGGATIEKLARANNMSNFAVRERLVAANEPRRRPGRQKKDISDTGCLAALRENMSMQAIADMTHSAVSTIRRAVERAREAERAATRQQKRS